MSFVAKSIITPIKFSSYNSNYTSKRTSIICRNSSNQVSTPSFKVKKQKVYNDMKINSWAPELINGRCAMLGYVAGYGYEFVNNESFVNQSLEYWPAFVIVSLLVTIATLNTGKPTIEDVQINGLTPEAELFNGRAAMVGITSTLLYELMLQM